MNEAIKSMKIIWDSIDSHLNYIGSRPTKGAGNDRHHRKCVKEYLEVLKELSKNI